MNISKGKEEVRDSSKCSSKSVSSSSSAEPSNQLTTEEKPSEKLPFKDILTEAEFQVKIADLGNACWTVITNNQ